MNRARLLRKKKAPARNAPERSTAHHQHGDQRDHIDEILFLFRKEIFFGNEKREVQVFSGGMLR